MSRSHAWLKGRDYVTPDDVKAIVHDVFRHRLIFSYEAHAGGITADKAIDRVRDMICSQEVPPAPNRPPGQRLAAEPDCHATSCAKR